MGSKYAVYVLILSLGTFISCGTTTEFPSKYRGEQLHFGQGGGFSGLVNYYVLLDDGRLYQKALYDSTFNYTDKWNKTFVRQMFSNYQMLDIENVDYFEPGDLYYFLQHKEGNQPLHSITWGRPGVKPQENIVTFYNLLYKSTKTTL